MVPRDILEQSHRDVLSRRSSEWLPHLGFVATNLRVYGPGGVVSDRDWKASFEKTYTGPPSAVAERIWRKVFGDAYPAGLDPNSLVSVDELRRIASELQLEDGDTFADIGCGRGGAGLWVAANTGASVVGVDIAPAALNAARTRAAAMGIEDRAEFREGSFEGTDSIPERSTAS